MNKYKKLILSLTITLLSFAGVCGMAKPIPQIKTFRELGTFVNQYSTNDFLTNKDVGFVVKGQKEGILEVLLNAYNSLPSGAKPLAENLFQSKFKMNSSQLSNKLSSLAGGKAIPVTIAQAQAIISTINKEKTDFQNQLNKFTRKLSNLKARIGRYKGNIADLESIREDWDEASDYIFNLNDIIDRMEEERADLKVQIAALTAQGATAQQLKPLQDQLAAANTAIATLEATIKNQTAEIDALNKKIAILETKVPKEDQADLLFGEYDALAQGAEKFYTDDVQKIVVPNKATIQNMDMTAVVNLLNRLTDDRNLIIEFDKNTKPKWDVLEDKWVKLALPATSPKIAEKPQHSDKVANSMLKILNKADDINKAGGVASNRLSELEQQAGQKEVAAIIKDLTDIQQEYDDFKTAQKSEPLFANTTIEKFILDPTLIDPLNDVKDIPLLEAGMKKLTAYGTKITQKHKQLQAKLNPIIAKISTLTPSQQNAIEAVANAVDQRAAEYLDIPEEVTNLKDIIQARIDHIRPLPPTPEEALNNEIDAWVKTLPASQQIQQAIKDEDRLTPTIAGFTEVDALNGEKSTSQAPIDQYSKYVTEFNDWKTKAKNVPSALGKINAVNPLITPIETLISKARANIKAIDTKISEISGGTTPPAADIVSDVAVDTDNYNLTFKLGDIIFRSDATDATDMQFLNNIVNPKITETGLKNAGADLAKNQTPQDLRTIAGDILRAEYDKAEKAEIKAHTANDAAAEATANAQKNNLRILVEPILVAYKESAIPAGKDADYWTGNSEYKGILKGFFGNNLPNELK